MVAALQPYGISLPIQRGDSGYFSQTYDIVQQTKYNLIMFLQTRKGERRGNPSFGSSLYNVLFGVNNDDLGLIVENIIKKDIQDWFPELDIFNIRVTTGTDSNPHTINISLEFVINGFGQTIPQKVSFEVNQSVA
jgi:phage baseplate assembly protein W